MRWAKCISNRRIPVKKTSEYVAFPAVVCERLRALVRIEKKAKAMRQDAFDARDQHEEEFNCAGTEKAKERAAAEYGRKVLEVERITVAIRAIAAEKNSTIERADEPGLFGTGTADLAEFLPDPAAAADDGQGVLSVVRPVGKPTAREPAGNTAARAIQDGYVEGVPDHLKASVVVLTDYKVPGPVIRQCVKEGFETVAQAAAWFDDGCPDGVMDFLDEAGVKALGAGLRAYRKMHASVTSKANGAVK